MDFTKDYKNKVNSLLMEKWGYGEMDEAVEELEDLEGTEEQQPLDKMSAGDFKTKGIEQAKAGSESGMDAKERAIISQLIDILKGAAANGNITTGRINALLNKAAEEAKKIS